MDIEKAFNSAFEHYQAGDLDRAEPLFQEVLSIQPENMDVLYLLAEVSYMQKKYDQAVEYMKRAIRIDPRNAEVYSNLGFILQENGQIDEAIEYLKKAVEFNPHLIDAHYNLANAFKKAKHLDEAIYHYRKTIESDPNFSDAYINLGNTLQENKQFDEAIACYHKLLQLNPSHPDAYNNLGITFQEKGQFDEAIASYKKSLQINPAHADVYNNLGFALYEKGQIPEAITHYQKALQLDPSYATAHWNLSLALLLSGDFKEGWREYEWRWGTRYLSSFRRDFPQPIWNGSDISGQTMLLHAEQGFGDAIQFIRYAPLVAQRGVKLIVECRQPLVSLIQQVEGIKEVIRHGESLPEFDVHCPLLSLPMLFDTTLETIPAKIPYINADSLLVTNWQKRIRNDNSKYKIGLAWAGNPEYKQNRYRNCPLQLFAPLAELDNVTFYSLQKGEESKETKNPPNSMRILDYSEELHNFMDTAALIANMDLVICVDTAVAHLTGALGKPVWVLIPFTPDWRWLLSREDNPWYPTARLFRQSSIGDWKTVIEKISQALSEKIRNGRNGKIRF